MRNMSASRWVPAYDIYELVEQPTKYVVSITHEDRFTPGSDEVRAVSGRRVSDARILEEFTRLAHPKTDSADLFNFINSFGALGGMLDYLPSDLARVIPQEMTTEERDYPARLVCGTGAPVVNLGPKTALTTIELYRDIASLVVAALALDTALQAHGDHPWHSYVRRRGIEESLRDLELRGFRVLDVAILSALAENPAPPETGNRELDATACFLARYGSRDLVDAVSRVPETPGIRRAELLARAQAYRNYWKRSTALRSVCRQRKHRSNGICGKRTSAAFRTSPHGSWPQRGSRQKCPYTKNAFAWYSHR
ncbi:MAG: hypothetical protein ACYC2K_11805 [Gemmatimonadales bacterium]